MMQRQPRIRDEKHLAWVRTLPCIVTGDNVSVEAAHIRYSDPRIGKNNPGVGQKPHDFFVLPLSGKQHRRQHAMNECVFWQRAGIDPILFALALYAVSGDHERGCEIVACAGRPLADNVLAAG